MLIKLLIDEMEAARWRDSSFRCGLADDNTDYNTLKLLGETADIRTETIYTLRKSINKCVDCCTGG